MFYRAAEAVPGWRKPSDYNKANDDQPSKTGSERANTANTSRERPVIQIAAGELPRMVDEAEAALIAAETPIFVRAGALVGIWVAVER